MGGCPVAKFTGNSMLTKKINRSLILQHIRREGTLSRADLVQCTGLTSGTVSNLTRELLKEGLIRTTGRADSTGGRPQTLLEINSHAFYALGTNIGATRTISVVTDLDGHKLAEASAAMGTEANTGRQLDAVVQSIEDAIAASKVDRAKIIGAGIGVPGLLDSARGISLFSPNLGWRQLPIKDILEQRVRLPVTIDNAVRAAALAEKWWGAGRGEAHLVALFAGTGIGAGVVIDGKVYRGAGEAAGEIGHVRVAEDGDICSCGARGCLEAMASGPAIARQAKTRLASGEKSILPDMLGDLSRLSGLDVYRAAKAGDGLSLGVLEEAGRYIGIGMAMLINLFDPGVLVFNGGVSHSWDLIGPAVLDAVESRTMRGAAKSVRIVRSELGADVGPLGGAALVIQELFSIPDIQRGVHVS